MYSIDKYYDHYVIKREEDNSIVFHYDNYAEAEKELKELNGKDENQTVVKNDGRNYTVYHLHSDLSNGVTNIDSVTKYKEYVEYAKSLGMTALAFAEHGNIFEWIHKKEAIEEAGMKYIHAAEVYLTDNDSSENITYSAIDLFLSAQTKKDIRVKIKDYYQREDGAWVATIDDENHLNYGKATLIDIDSLEKEYVKHRDNYHCVLIAKNYDGVKELNRLISSSFNRDDYHFYYAPRIGLNELYATSNNIIVTTACLGGVLNKAIDDNVKREFMRFLIKNKHRCYLEIQHHNCEDQATYNKMLYEIHKKFDIPLIAGTDTHCLNDTHVEGRNILQKGKNVFFSDEELWDLTFKTYNELVEAYKKQNALPEEVYLEAIHNTNVMADSIEAFELDYSKKYPKLYDDSEKVLKQKILKGIKNRGVDKYDNFDEYKEKIQYELETYKHNGAVDFLLLEEDYKSALKEQGISFGYSRGSVSGSVIAYLLGITEVDSIRYNLNFER